MFPSRAADRPIPRSVSGTKTPPPLGLRTSPNQCRAKKERIPALLLPKTLYRPTSPYRQSPRNGEQPDVTPLLSDINGTGTSMSRRPLSPQGRAHPTSTNPADRPVLSSSLQQTDSSDTCRPRYHGREGQKNTRDAVLPFAQMSAKTRTLQPPLQESQSPERESVRGAKTRSPAERPDLGIPKALIQPRILLSPSPTLIHRRGLSPTEPRTATAPTRNQNRASPWLVGDTPPQFCGQC